MPPAVTMSLYFVIFGSLIGPRIGTMDGLDYIQFMIPGLIMMSVITNSYANVVSSFYSVKFQKSIEELLISPMPNWAILTGFVMGGVSRGILIGFIVFCVSLFFYPTFDIANPVLTILVLILTSILFVFVDVIKELPATLILRPFDFNTLAVKAYELASDERLIDASIPSVIIVFASIPPDSNILIAFS